MVFGLFSSKPRKLVNGAKEEHYVRTAPSDTTAPMWFAECYFVSQAFSEGDRSALAAALLSARQGEVPVLMTANGTVTHELYNRLMQFGYIEPGAHDFPDGMGQWKFRKDQHNHALGFILASRVDTLSVADLTRVSRGISKHRKSFDRIGSNLLEIMRRGVTHKDHPFADGKIRSAEYKAMASLGLIYAKEGTWRPTELGSLVLPYLFDHLLNVKRLWLEERNA